jgi:fumarate hydratase subunit beta
MVDATRGLTLPLSEADVRALRIGDMVRLSGEIVITAGMPTHERILEYLNAGKPLPTQFEGGTLFHLGSYSREVAGRYEVLYMNPTTSTRFNPYMPTLVRRLGVRAIGGKGGLDHASVAAMQETGCVYLSFLGGGAALHTSSIKAVVSVDWSDLIFQYRLVRLRVENLGPLTVAIDAHGNSIYDDLSGSAQDRLPRILQELASERDAASSSRRAR